MAGFFLYWDKNAFYNGFAAVMDHLITDTKAAAGLAAIHEADYEFGLSQKLVPVATSELQKSGRVEANQEKGSLVTVDIAYGGPAGSGNNDVDVDYAIIVHEDLTAHHPRGQAKYVEEPVRAEMESGRAAARMGAEIVRLMSGIKVATRARGANGRFISRTQG